MDEDKKERQERERKIQMIKENVQVGVKAERVLWAQQWSWRCTGWTAALQGFQAPSLLLSFKQLHQHTLSASLLHTHMCTQSSRQHTRTHEYPALITRFSMYVQAESQVANFKKAYLKSF